VPFSTGNAVSIVELTIFITNPSQTDSVNCAWIKFSIDPGAAGGDLIPTDTMNLITVTPGAATPWAAGPSGTGSFVVLPLPPASGLAPQETIGFTFGNVIVNSVSGDSDITIGEQTSQYAKAYVTVEKSGTLSPPQYGAPQIASFTATPSDVALYGQSLLSWNVIGATNLVLEPGPVALQPPAGTLPVTVTDTTTYTLTAYSYAGGSTPASVTVTVMPVQIVSFTAAPNSVAAGSPVTLQWETQYAYSCSIDQGIGPVTLTGSTVVTPQQTTIYTLTANGRAPQTYPVTVTVT